MEITTATILTATWFLYFIIYSILGWAAETLYCSVPQKHFAERGFLIGPYCPIYGFGALLVLAILEPFFSSPPLIFLLGMLATTILEYITSVVMERLFHMRWWDYSKHKFNIKGRVCLLNSTLFGILCLVLVLFIHPLIKKWVDIIPHRWLIILSVAILILFLIDLIFSVRAVIQLDKHLAQLREMEEKFKEEWESLKTEGEEMARQKIGETEEKLRQWKEESEKKVAEIKAANRSKAEKLLASLKIPAKYQERRIMRSFPKLCHMDKDKNISLDALKHELIRWGKNRFKTSK